MKRTLVVIAIAVIAIIAYPVYQYLTYSPSDHMSSSDAHIEQMQEQSRSIQNAINSYESSHPKK